MSRDARFWRNVAIIAFAHVAILLGVLRWNRAVPNAAAQSIIWMNGAAADGDEATTTTKNARLPRVSEPEPAPSETPQMIQEAAKAEDDEQPVVRPAKSEIQLPAATPTPVAAATLKSTPLVTPKPWPKPTAKPKPKPTATPQKKLGNAKASPKPTAKPSVSPAKDSQAEGDETKDKAAKKAIGEQAGNGKSGSSEGSGASQFGWYGSMLHDRFYSEWVQPTTVVASGAKMSALVKLRIERDGRVSQFNVVRPSGNVVVDESVAAVAKRVTHVDPLPKGLGGDYYEVKINFELNPEQ